MEAVAGNYHGSLLITSLRFKDYPWDRVDQLERLELVLTIVLFN